MVVETTVLEKHRIRLPVGQALAGFSLQRALARPFHTAVCRTSMYWSNQESVRSGQALLKAAG